MPIVSPEYGKYDPVGTDNLCGFAAMAHAIDELYVNRQMGPRTNPIIMEYLHALAMNELTPGAIQPGANREEFDGNGDQIPVNNQHAIKVAAARAAKQAFVNVMLADTGVTPFDQVMGVAIFSKLFPRYAADFEGSFGAPDFFVKEIANEHELDLRPIYNALVDRQRRNGETIHNINPEMFMAYLLATNKALYDQIKQKYCAELMKDSYQARDIDLMYIARKLNCFSTCYITHPNGDNYPVKFDKPSGKVLNLYNQGGGHWQVGYLFPHGPQARAAAAQGAPARRPVPAAPQGLPPRPAPVAPPQAMASTQMPAPPPGLVRRPPPGLAPLGSAPSGANPHGIVIPPPPRMAVAGSASPSAPPLRAGRPNDAAPIAQQLAQAAQIAQRGRVAAGAMREETIKQYHVYIDADGNIKVKVFSNNGEALAAKYQQLIRQFGDFDAVPDHSSIKAETRGGTKVYFVEFNFPESATSSYIAFKKLLRDFDDILPPEHVPLEPVAPPPPAPRAQPQLGIPPALIYKTKENSDGRLNVRIFADSEAELNALRAKLAETNSDSFSDKVMRNINIQHDAERNKFFLRLDFANKEDPIYTALKVFLKDNNIQRESSKPTPNAHNQPTPSSSQARRGKGWFAGIRKALGVDSNPEQPVSPPPSPRRNRR
jgi:hypothetical protein